MVFLIDALFILYNLTMLTSFTLIVCGCKPAKKQTVCPVREVTTSMRIAPASDPNGNDSTRTAMDKSEMRRKDGSHKSRKLGKKKSTDTSIKVSKKSKKSLKGKKGGKKAEPVAVVPVAPATAPASNNSNERVKKPPKTPQAEKPMATNNSKENPKSAATQLTPQTIESVPTIDSTAPTGTKTLAVSQSLPNAKDIRATSPSPGASPGVSPGQTPGPGTSPGADPKDSGIRSALIQGGVGGGGAQKSVPAF